MVDNRLSNVEQIMIRVVGFDVGSQQSEKYPILLASFGLLKVDEEAIERVEPAGFSVPVIGDLIILEIVDLAESPFV